MIHSNSIANESDRTVIKVRLHKKISIKDVFTKCDQIPKETTDLVTFTEKSLMENFIFCPVTITSQNIS